MLCEKEYENFLQMFTPIDYLMPCHRILNDVFKKSALRLTIPADIIDKYQLLMLHADIDTHDETCTLRCFFLAKFWILYTEACRKEGGAFHDALREQTNVGVVLLNHTLNLWLNPNWHNIALRVRKYLIKILRQGVLSLPLINGMKLEYMFEINMTPWDVEYLNNLFENIEKPNTAEMDDKVLISTTYTDFEHFRREGLQLTFLRLIKLFDGRCMQQVQIYVTRLLESWHHNNWSPLNWEHSDDNLLMKSGEIDCIIYICHIYLMVVYEADDNNGSKIDKMIQIVRFYFDNMAAKNRKNFNKNIFKSVKKLTPAMLIAMTSYRLNISINNLFKRFILRRNVGVHPTLYGIIGQAYGSYLLGKILIDISINDWKECKSNNEDFIELFKLYIEIRERSEYMLKEEILKSKAKYNSHNGKHEVCITIFKDHINKGNKHYENNRYPNSDTEISKEPVFEFIPANLDLLWQIYSILSEQSYEGWYMGKVMLLLKLIGHQWNEIEMYRYQLGMGTEFMLKLDMKLSKYFENLALLLEDHQLIAQEFWLTAFYLNPTKDLLAQVSRFGLINKRRDKQQNLPVKAMRNSDVAYQMKLEKICKHELLSSIIDVEAITSITQNKSSMEDYNVLYHLLGMLRLPNKYIKDMLTVCFAARSKNLSWAISWNRLQLRCKKYLTNQKLKLTHVAQTMAEAYDKLNYLDVDYDKYRNRPQLDYGCIENGYEHGIPTNDKYGDQEDDVFLSSDEDYTDLEPILKKNSKVELLQHQSSKQQKSQSQLEQIGNCEVDGGPRTRARTAQAYQKTLSPTKGDNINVRGDADSRNTNEKEIESQIKNNYKDEDNINLAEIKSNIRGNYNEKLMKDLVENQVKSSIDTNKLMERLFYANNTPGYNPILNIWNQELNDLENISLVFYNYLQEYKQHLKSYAALDDYLEQMQQCSLLHDICMQNNEKKCSSEPLVISNNFHINITIDETDVNDDPLEIENAEKVCSSDNTISINSDDILIPESFEYDSNSDVSQNIDEEFLLEVVREMNSEYCDEAFTEVDVKNDRSEQNDFIVHHYLDMQTSKYAHCHEELVVDKDKLLNVSGMEWTIDDIQLLQSDTIESPSSHKNTNVTRKGKETEPTITTVPLIAPSVCCESNNSDCVEEYLISPASSDNENYDNSGLYYRTTKSSYMNDSVCSEPMEKESAINVINELFGKDNKDEHVEIDISAVQSIIKNSCTLDEQENHQAGIVKKLEITRKPVEKKINYGGNKLKNNNTELCDAIMEVDDKITETNMSQNINQQLGNIKAEWVKMISVMTNSFTKIINMIMTCGLDCSAVQFRSDEYVTEDYMRKYLLRKLLNEKYDMPKFTTDEFNIFLVNSLLHISGDSLETKTTQSISKEVKPDNSAQDERHKSLNLQQQSRYAQKIITEEESEKTTENQNIVLENSDEEEDDNKAAKDEEDATEDENFKEAKNPENISGDDSEVVDENFKEAKYPGNASGDDSEVEQYIFIAETKHEPILEPHATSSTAINSGSNHKQCHSLGNKFLSSNEDASLSLSLSSTSSSSSPAPLSISASSVIENDIIVPFNPNWQPQVNVKRLKIVQGHVIRKFQVRVKRVQVGRPKRKQGKSRCLCGC